MLSVRLPETLENQLNDYCAQRHTSKSAVVQELLEKHLRTGKAGDETLNLKNPFAAFIGSGNRKYSTDEIMRMTRGDDWNKP